MGKFDGVLIVSDIDGTFLDGNGRVVPENVEKIKYFISEGGKFTFATGRINDHISAKVPCVKEITNAPGLLANGTYFYDFATGERTGEEFLNVPLLRKLLHYVKENYPSIEYRVATRLGQITDSVKGPRLSLEYEASSDGFFHVFPIDEFPGEDWYKCVFRADPSDISVLRDDIESKYQDEFCFSLSGPDIYELQKKGTSKGEKLLELKAKYASLGTPVTSYACGDYENDYEMLKAADVAVCPTNALDKIKAICDISPCDNDEGLIAALIDIIEKK